MRCRRQADGYPEFCASRGNDLHLVRAGAERYEIPEAAVLGGEDPIIAGHEIDLHTPHST